MTDSLKFGFRVEEHTPFSSSVGERKIMYHFMVRWFSSNFFKLADFAAGDVNNASLSFDQDEGLIDSVKSVKEVVEGIVSEAEGIIKGRIQSLLR